MRLLSGQDEVVLRWLSKRVDFTLSPHTHLIWATDDSGHLLGAVAAGGRMGKTWGSLSIALADAQAALPLIRAGCSWLFGAQEARAAYVTISNKRGKWIESLIKTMGFREVDRVRAGISYREDLVILKVTPETCRPWQAELRKLRALHALEAS